MREWRNSDILLVYLDTNAYCRPFDDQTQDRIKREATASVGLMDTLISEHYRQATLLKGSLHIIVLGWEALVEKLGYEDATRFIMLLDKAVETRFSIPETCGRVKQPSIFTER